MVQSENSSCLTARAWISHLLHSQSSEATLWSHLNPDDLDIPFIGVLKQIKGYTSDRFTELHKMGLSWLNAQVEQIRANEQTRSVIIFTSCTGTNEELQIRNMQEDPRNLLSPRNWQMNHIGDHLSRFGLLDIRIGRVIWWRKKWEL